MSNLLYRLGTNAEECVHITEETTRGIYQQLIRPFIGHSRLAAKDIGIGVLNSHMSQRTQELFAIVDQCLRCDLVIEAKDLVVARYPALPPVTSDFWVKWRHLIAFVTSLVTILQRHNKAELNRAVSSDIAHSFRSAYQSVLDRRPLAPSNWSRPQACYNDGCKCEPCQTVRQFLGNPVQQEESFTYKQDIRKHIQTGFRIQEDFVFTTSTNKLPHTLRIRKTNNAFDRNMRQWKIDMRDMRNELARLQTRFMSDLLGDDILTIAVGSGTGNAAETSSRSTGKQTARQGVLQTTSATAQNAATPSTRVGTKRKAEIIDLTEDYPLE
ncbi:hypothetical protein ACEQ8H_002157 [Pleosporales sp. CAS-2024a]